MATFCYLMVRMEIIFKSFCRNGYFLSCFGTHRYFLVHNVLFGGKNIEIYYCILSWMGNFLFVSSFLLLFSKHRPSGQMLSISRYVRLRVPVSVCPSICLSVCSLLRYCLNVCLPPLPKVKCPILLEVWNPWGKVVERSGLRFVHFCSKIV